MRASSADVITSESCGVGEGQPSHSFAGVPQVVGREHRQLGVPTDDDSSAVDRRVALQLAKADPWPTRQAERCEDANQKRPSGGTDLRAL
jgi:hypothetical protein